MQSTDLLIIERAGEPYQASVSELPSGGGASAGMQRTNSASFNANTAGSVTFGTTGPTYGAGFTAVASGVQCDFDGIVRVSSSLYFTGSTARGSVSLQATVGGSTTGPLYNQSYVRNSGGHNENGCVLPSVLLAVTNGDAVGVNHAQQAANGTLTVAVGNAVLLVERVA